MIYTFTEPGEGHINEDAIEHRPHPAAADFALCAIADGQGGRSGGQMAARVAVTSALDAACATPPEALLLPSTWLNICSIADLGVAAADNAGYCTLVSMGVTGRLVVGASSGDSAAVLILEQASVILTNRQRKYPPVGSGGAKFEQFSAKLGKWWRILVVSDGVWKYIGWERMIAVGRGTRGDDIAAVLRREGTLRFGESLPDDFSIIVIES